MNKKVSPISICCGLLYVLCIFCGSAISEQENNKNNKDRGSLPLSTITTEVKLEEVNIAHSISPVNLIFLPIYLAIEKGIFEKNGLKINLNFYSSESLAYQSLMDKQNKFCLCDSVQAAISYERDKKGKVIANIANKYGLSIFSNKQDLTEFKNAYELSNYKLGVAATPLPYYNILNSFYLENNYFASGADLIEVAKGTEFQSLDTGIFQLYADIEPNISIAESKGYKYIFPFDLTTKSQPVVTLVTLSSTIDFENPLVKKMIFSVQRGLDFITDKDSEILKILSKYLSDINKDILNTALNRLYKFEVFPKNVLISKSEWLNRMKNAQTSSLVLKLHPLEYIVENSHAQEILKIMKKSIND